MTKKDNEFNNDTPKNKSLKKKQVKKAKRGKVSKKSAKDKKRKEIKMKKKKQESSDDDYESESEEENEKLKSLANKINKKYNLRNRRNKKNTREKEEETEEDEETEENEDEEYFEEEDEAFEEMLANAKENMKFNIIFTVGDKNGRGGFPMLGDEDYDYDGEYQYMIENGYEDEWTEEEEDEEDEEEDEEDEEEDEEDEEEEEEEQPEQHKKGRKKVVNKKDKPKKFNKGDKVLVAVDDKKYDCNVLKKQLVRLKSKKKVNRYKVKITDDKYKKKKKVLENIKEMNLSLKEEKNDDEDALNEMKSMLEEYKKGGKDKMVNKLEKLINAGEKEQKKKKKKKDQVIQRKNTAKLRKMLREKDVMNDFKYFSTMDVEKQKKIISELESINKVMNIEKPYRITLLETDIPHEFKADALKKVNLLSYMSPETGEYYKIKQWVDTFMRIPFGKHKNLPLSIEDGPEKCCEFISDAKKTLDEAVYGLDDAKMQIMQMIGQWISNPDSVGTAIAIKGPMGTGKTTLVKEGVSKILNRPFAFLALGGATDSSFLEGHSYTYEGSSWGKVIDILIQCQCMNPVIYFDELDKVSDTPKGEEIIGILTHLTDTTQNTQFHDKYFSNMDFNLSKALFIFSYNDENKVNPILRDRMYKITTKGYSNIQKITISQKYLIPKIHDLVKFEDDNIIIPDETITYLCEHLTNKERGVRNLKRCLEIIYSKLNLFRLTDGNTELFDNEKSFKITFPFTVTTEIVSKLIKKNDENAVPFGMYI